MSKLSLLIFSLLLPGASLAACDQPLRADLPHLRAALADHQLSLLVIAPAPPSADPLGADPNTGADDGSLPFQIEAATRARRPDLAIDLDRLDNSGQGVADMMPILAGRLSERPIALVVWQAGAVEMARGTQAALFSASLADAATLINTAGADLILVDPNPGPAANPAIEAALSQAAGHSGTALYHQTSADPACSSHGIAHLIGGF